MIVCIAEKPSVAQEIAKILGANISKEGYYEGNGYQVTWTFGHLCELKSPYEYTSIWSNWDLNALPMLPNKFGIKVKDESSIQLQFAIIESLIKEADEIINCGDAGQEGEVIQRWVMQKIGVKCPVKRLWVSSLTEEAIKKGFENLKDNSEYQSLYEAGVCRAIGDWLLGLNATRLYTLKYGKDKQVLSIGRVQTPTLAMIVKRQNEIDKFVPEPYWILQTNYKNVNFQATRGKFNQKEEGEKVFKEIESLPFIIKKVDKKEGTELPPQLFDLTTLQVECNKQFGFPAEETLRTIQSLYEKKLTTYPRVDTRYLSDDIYSRCQSIINGIYGYNTFKNDLLGKKLRYSKRVFDNSKITDHHAIIPTGVPAHGMSNEEYFVYDLIVRSFLAVFYSDYKFQQNTILGSVGNIEFKATQKQTLDLGWKILYKNDEEENLIEFEVGESGTHKPSLLDKMTTPPKFYTEASLLRAMETAGQFVEDDKLREVLKENGIGRPSSRAAIIETLFKRDYIKRDKKNIVANPTGIKLIELIHEEMLISPELTAVWEKKLRDIENKKYSAQQFIKELSEQIEKIVLDIKNE